MRRRWSVTIKRATDRSEKALGGSIGVSRDISDALVESRQRVVTYVTS